MDRHGLLNARRSFAMSPTLPGNIVGDLLDTCERLMVEREAVERILAGLSPAWTDTRRALNELHALIFTAPEQPP
jgi:hypothetical protein